MNKIIIWTRPECIYCEKAKALLSENYIPFDIVELTEENYPKLLELVPNAKTVPQIFEEHSFGSIYIGGYSELEAILKNRNQLDYD